MGRRTVPAREEGEVALHDACGLPWDEHRPGGICPDQPLPFEPLPARP